MASWKQERERSFFECCIGCVTPKRYPGCSGKCNEYAEAKAKHEERKKEYSRQIEASRVQASAFKRTNITSKRNRQC